MVPACGAKGFGKAAAWDEAEHPRRSAIAKLLADPMLRRWQQGELGREVPVLWYFCRAYSTRNSDGLVTEHGDGFSLTFVEPEELEQLSERDRGSVAVAAGLDVLVVSEENLLSGSLLIGWRKWKYTCEPLYTVPDISLE